MTASLGNVSHTCYAGVGHLSARPPLGPQRDLLLRSVSLISLLLCLLFSLCLPDLSASSCPTSADNKSLETVRSIVG